MRFLFLLLFFSLVTWGDSIEIETQKYYINSDNNWTIEDAYKNKDKFSVLTSNHESLGFRQDSIWIYVRIHNVSDVFLQQIIHFPYPLHDYITVYKYKAKKLVENYDIGDLRKFNLRKIDTNDFVIPYQLNANESIEIFFKINSNSSLNIGMKFHSLEQYYANATNNILFLGIYYGAVLIMLIYNFILFIMIKEKVYLDYVNFHFAYIFLHLGLNGLSFQYFYPNNPSINLYFIPILFSLSNYLSIKFTISFLGLEKYRPKIAHYLKILMNAFLVLILFNLFFPYSIVIMLNTVLSIFSVFVLFATAVYVLKKVHTTSAKFFVIAWSFLLLGAFVGELQNLGLITMNIFTYYGAQIGALVELSLLSIALAYRYNVVFLTLTDREQQLRVFNRNLETKIRERTEDLDDRNKELKLQINNKNILFRELYHRVKNNLQIVSSLLTLQIRRVEGKKSKEILSETTQRIKAMSMIHEKLYQSNNLSVVNMQSYTQDLVRELQQGFKRPKLHFTIECEDIELNLEVAVPMGLIINELVTNAIKYAFNKHEGDEVITVKMYTSKSYTLILEIYDNGEGVEVENIHEGFGFKLVQSLAKYQLKGEIEIYNNKGLHHKIIFQKGLLA